MSRACGWPRTSPARRDARVCPGPRRVLGSWPRQRCRPSSRPDVSTDTGDFSRSITRFATWVAAATPSPGRRTANSLPAWRASDAAGGNA